jgi:plastocyanin
VAAVAPAFAQVVSPPMGVPGAVPFGGAWAPYAYRVPSISSTSGPSVTDYTGMVTPFGYWPPAVPSNTFVPSYPYVFVAVPQPVYVPVTPPRPAVELVQATVLTLRGGKLPAESRVKPGTVVTWMNAESRDRTLVFELPATAAASAEVTRSPGVVPANGSFSLAFHQPGTYTYYLQGQPEVRTQVVVEPPAGANAAPS